MIINDNNESILNKLQYANEIVEDLKHQYYPVTWYFVITPKFVFRNDYQEDVLRTGAAADASYLVHFRGS